MNASTVTMRNKHHVNLFSHIDNTCLSDDFFVAIERYKDEVMGLTRIRPHPIPGFGRADLDNLMFLDLISLLEKKLGIRTVSFPIPGSMPGRETILDEFLLAPMVHSELAQLRKVDSIDLEELCDYGTLYSLSPIIGKLGHDKVPHDSRNQFFGCYLNSFIIDHEDKLKNAIRSVLYMAVDERPTSGHSYYCEQSLSALRHTTFLNAAVHLGIQKPSDLFVVVDRFNNEDLKAFLEFDFLHGDLNEYSKRLGLAIKWISKNHFYEESKDTVIGDWLINQCAIFYAYYLNPDLLRTFIDATIDPLINDLNYEPDKIDNIKSLMFKQALLIEPEHFVAHGFTKHDFLAPLSNVSNGFKNPMTASQGCYTKSTENDFYWLAALNVQQIAKRTGFKLTSSEIMKHFSGKGFKIKILNTLKPEDRLSYFMNEMSTASNAHLKKTAEDLIETHDDRDTRLAIQNSYLLSLVKRNGDKPLDPKKMALNWIDKQATIAFLRESTLVGQYSGISLLGLSMDDLKTDVGELSLISKRHLLSSDLSI